MITLKNKCATAPVAGRQFSLVSLVVALTVSLLVIPAHAEIDVWIDPGHGDHDAGNVGINGDELPNEADLVFNVSERLMLELLGLGFFCVYMTRNSDDQFFSPEERAMIASGQIVNDEGVRDSCRVFVSVHMNAAPKESAFGTETYYARSKTYGKDAKSVDSDADAATEIHTDLLTYANVAFGPTCHKDREIRQENFAVLRLSKPPAVLVEICFLTNECQWFQITQPGWQNYMAEGLASGISGYLGFGFCQPLGGEPPAAHADSEGRLFKRPDRSQSPRLAQSRFTQGLTAVLTIFAENFDGATFPPSGWTTETAGLALPHRWHRTTDQDFVESGTGSAYVGSASPSAIDEWLISPAIAISAPNDAIKFLWAGNKYWSGAVNASLSVRPAGTGPWTQLWSLQTNEPTADPFIYRERVVDLSPWTGMNVEFGFRAAGTNGASFGLDDIAVGDFSPTGTALNDVCTGASPLPDIFNVQGMSCYAANDLDPYAITPGSCVNEHLNGADVFFEISAAWGDTLHASVVADWNAGLYLVDDCFTPVCVAGEFSEDGRSQDVLTHRFAPGGTYYIVVDGAQGSCGPFVLTGEIVDSPTGIQHGRTPGLHLAVLPNPADGPVRLSGSFPAAAGVQSLVEIFDVAGRRLHRFEGRADTGELSFVWDHRDERGQRVASGIYFARLKFGGESVVKKFVILR